MSVLLNDNSIMQELHDTMESFLVMRELTDTCNFELEVWRDMHGCMISYVKKDRRYKHEYALRFFYRDDREGYMAQFEENVIGYWLEGELDHLGRVEFNNERFGRRMVRIYFPYDKLSFFLSEVMREWGYFA